jgi:flagellar hook assembly protein FlgD
VLVAAGSRPELSVWPSQPNPFRTSTTLRFDLPRDQEVRVTVHDVTGRRVAVLRDGPERAGRHSLGWDGRDALGRRVAAGVYFARVSTPDASRSLKMVVLR